MQVEDPASEKVQNENSVVTQEPTEEGEQYKAKFELSNTEETAMWKQLRTVYGFRERFDDPSFSYCLSNLHCSAQFSDSDSRNVCVGGRNRKLK